MTLYRLKTNKDRTRSTVPKIRGTVNRSTVRKTARPRAGTVQGERVTIPSGTLTRNEKIPEDRILRAPAPKGEEYEAAQIDAAAAEYTPEIEREFSKILAFVLAGGTAAAMLARSDALPTAGLASVLPGLLTRAGYAAITIQAEVLAGVGIAVPVTLSENIVAQWAARYTFPLVTRINTVSRAALQRHLSQWAQANEDLPALERRLTPWFGSMRANRIAVTEATRAFSEGSFTSWERTGFDRRPAEHNRPPAHVNCRCFPAVAEGAPGDPYYYYIWYTVRDSFVCPICEPKHGNVIGVAGRL